MTKKEKILNYEECDLSFLHDNFYNIDKDFFLQYKSLKERLSSNYINYSIVNKNDIYFYEKALRYLTKTAFGLFQFVTNEKIPNIDFNFKTEESYCSLNTNKIQIGIGLLTQENIPLQVKVDTLVAIVFHEQYHKKYTIGDISKNLNLQVQTDYYNNKEVQNFLKEKLPTKLYGIIHNILEDRRIESLGADDFPGYTFFFEECRKYATFLHSEKKFSPQLPEAILLDYLLIKILLPELETKFFEQVELYGASLPELSKSSIIGTSGVSLFSNELKEIKKLLHIFKNYIEFNTKTIFSKKWSDILNETKKIHDLFPKDMQEKLNNANNAYINITVELGGENKNKGEKIELSAEDLLKLETAISDEIKKMEKEANEKDAQHEEEKTKIEKVVSKNNISNYSTIEMIQETLKPIDYLIYNEARNSAKNIFANLGFLDSKYNRTNEEYELLEGELDETELYSIGFNKHIFEEIEDVPGYALDFGILLDESGSMGSNIKEAKKAVLSLLLGLKDNKHINLYVYGHTANVGQRTSDIQMYKYYNTLERIEDWRTIFSARSRGNNADGYAIEKVAQIMRASKSKDKILCVVSDGQPHANNYGGYLAESHVRNITQSLENEGITVIQICMAFIENSPKMFKHFIPYEKNGKFFDNLKKILLTKLNQFADAI